MRALTLVAPCLLAAVPPLAGALAAQRPERLQGPHPGQAGGTFEILSCSLGCSPGSCGITCGTTAIHVNEELRVTFNRPVDPASVSGSTFLVLDLATGNSPPSTFALDPGDPNTLIWRPALSFDSAGNPVFGLRLDHTYLLKLPGTEQDPLGPFLTSLDGLPNRTRLQCVLVASRGILDLVPGRPLAKVFVLVSRPDPLGGRPPQVVQLPAEGAFGVLRGSPIEIVFADFMNPATVANPVTGQSSFIRIALDPDGNVQDASDQLPVPGVFALSIDPGQNVTRALFHATGGLPTSGPAGRVVVSLAPEIADLGGNALANPGTTTFTTR